MKSRILMIDDEAEIRESLRMILEYEGYEVARGVERRRGARAGRARSARPGVPRRQDAGHGRPRGAQRLQASRETLPVVVISGHAHARKRSRARSSAARSTSSRSRSAATACWSRSRTRSNTSGCATRTRRSSARSKCATRWSARAPALRQVWEAIKRAAPDQRHRAAARRERRRQGARRALDPPQQPAQPRPLRAGQLRGDSRGADRVGAVRSREGLVHRRDREADRQVRAGRQGARSSSTKSAT